MKISWGVSELWRVDYRPLPLTRPTANKTRALSMGEDDDQPSTAPRPLDRFSWNLKYVTNSQTRPCMQNVRVLCQRGWSGQIASLTHESFCPFLVGSPRLQVASLDEPPRSTRITSRSGQVSAFCGLEWRNLKFDTLYHKNVKKFGISWRQSKIVVVLILQR